MLPAAIALAERTEMVPGVDPLGVPIIPGEQDCLIPNRHCRFQLIATRRIKPWWFWLELPEQDRLSAAFCTRTRISQETEADGTAMPIVPIQSDSVVPVALEFFQGHLVFCPPVRSWLLVQNTKNISSNYSRKKMINSMTKRGSMSSFNSIKQPISRPP